MLYMHLYANLYEDERKHNTNEEGAMGACSLRQ